MGAGEIKIKANSAFKLSLSLGLAWAELGNTGYLQRMLKKVYLFANFQRQVIGKASYSTLSQTERCIGMIIFLEN